MLNFPVIFLLIALAAAVLGFGIVANSAIMIANVFFGILLVLFVASLFRGRRI